MQYPQPESNVLELKRQLPNTLQIIKTMVAFCNTRGGQIIVGVDDDLNIIGLNNLEIDRALNAVDQAVFSASSPRIVPRIYVRAYGDKSVIVIEVFEGMNKPYYIQAEGIENGTYIRVGRHTLRATSEIIQELKWHSSGIDYERLPVFQAQITDLDISSISKFLKLRQSHAEVNIDDQILRSYNIVTRDQNSVYPTVLGLLIFGKNPQHYLSEAMIICSHFKGTSGRETMATIDCEGSLFNQFHQAFQFIEQRLNKSFTITGLQRNEQLEIPAVAIREALLNIIIHRNYHINAPSKIAIYDDRVEFFSPGQFHGPIDPENLKAGITYLRNPAICKILREAKYIEKLGSGFITMFDSCKHAGLNEPTIVEGESYVKCTLSREEDLSTVNKEQPKSIPILEELFKFKNELTIQEISDSLHVSRPTAVRKLNAWINQGLIERIGNTKNMRYKLLEYVIHD